MAGAGRVGQISSDVSSCGAELHLCSGRPDSRAESLKRLATLSPIYLNFSVVCFQSVSSCVWLCLSLQSAGVVRVVR